MNMISLCRTASVTMLLLAALAVAGSAQTQVISRQELDKVIADVTDLIGRNYGFEDRKAALAAALREGVSSGRYNVSRLEFATRVTADLQKAGGDLHLGLKWDSVGAAAIRARETAPGSSQAYFAEAARRTNHGLTEMRVLQGNVRYLRIARFDWQPDVTGHVYDAAMRFLADGDAAIIDIRDNGGGDGTAVQYLVSHFMNGAATQLLTMFRDDAGKPLESRVLPHLPGSRMIGKKLFVLTNRLTNSAAEEFALHVREFKLGTLVGDRTRGGGNSNAHYAVLPGYMLSLSRFRPVHGATGSWFEEGVGITPHIAVGSDLALAAAQIAALDSLARTTTDEARRFEYVWERELLHARANPVEVSESQLAGLAGVFGERQLTVNAGRLVYSRTGRPSYALSPLTSTTFAFEDGTVTRLRVMVENGCATAIEAYYYDNTSQRYARTSPCR